MDDGGGSFAYSGSSVYEALTNGNWSVWSQIYTDLFVQIPTDLGDTPVLELSIIPSDDTQGALSTDIGSILISAPVLEFFPDGFPE